MVESNYKKKGSVALIGGEVLIPGNKGLLQKSILIEKGIITCIDSDSIVSKLARKKKIIQVVSKAKAILPGPIDSHFHLLLTGLHLAAIDLGACKSIADILDCLRSHKQDSNQESWILGKGLDEFNLKEKRPPTAQELDSVAPHHPVFLEDRGLHYCQLNSVGLKKIGISFNLPGFRKFKNGTPTGQLMEEITGEARNRLLSHLDEGHKRKIIFEGAQYAASCGVTSLHAMEGGEISGDGEIPLLLEISDKLPVRVSIHWNTDNLRLVQQEGLRIAGGDLWLDGSIGSRTAALKKPYADDMSTNGFLYYSNRELKNIIRNFVDKGIQVGFHAIGDLAIEQALSVFEKIRQDGLKSDRLFRLDHFGVPEKDQIQKASKLGVVISTQPTFPYLRSGPGSIYESRLGKKRMNRAYPLKDLVKEELLVAGGSDCDVVSANVMLGLHSAVNHPLKAQRIKIHDALKLYTSNAARIEFEEDSKGEISVGKFGDLIIVDKNPFKTDKKYLKDLKILMTIVGGVIVHDIL